MSWRWSIVLLVACATERPIVEFDCVDVSCTSPDEICSIDCDSGEGTCVPLPERCQSAMAGDSCIEVDENEGMHCGGSFDEGFTCEGFCG